MFRVNGALGGVGAVDRITEDSDKFSVESLDSDLSESRGDSSGVFDERGGFSAGPDHQIVLLELMGGVERPSGLEVGLAEVVQPLDAVGARVGFVDLQHAELGFPISVLTSHLEPCRRREAVDHVGQHAVEALDADVLVVFEVSDLRGHLILDRLLPGGTAALQFEIQSHQAGKLYADR